jgi:methionyl-tRNA formyltransferase
MSKKDLTVLFLGAQDHEQTDKALAFCRQNFKECTAYLGRWGDPLPEETARWKGDYIISHLSRWIIPASILASAKIAAINFHPGPPEYPGIGCNNLALYEQAEEYGTTCHHMAAEVDTGAIIALRRFPVFETDDVASLLGRTHDHQLLLFYEIAGALVSGNGLPVCSETWTRKPFSRAELDQLGKITIDMSEEEIKRRVRATNYGKWKPVMEHHGFTFQLETSPSC